MIDVIELNIAIMKSKITKRKIANILGISVQALYNKLNNSVEFKASEIVKLCEILNIKNEDRDKIFFAKNVE